MAAMPSSPEVVIIGSGIGGGTLANRLVQHGLNVTILERGGYLPQEPENWDVAAVFFHQKYLPQETWLDKEGTAFRPGTYYYVGGSSKMYGGTMLRLRERDFEDLEHAGGVSPAWPVPTTKMLWSPKLPTWPNPGRWSASSKSPVLQYLQLC